ncbi:MAG: PH domain-containing protein [Anaerolineae bacterium]|nr:PH domain-containing protein [Anaerolineae bacterium]
MTGEYLKSLMGDKERILLITRQHWFILVRNILLEIALILIILAVCIAVSILMPPIGSLAFLGLLLAIIPLVGLVHDVLVWSNNQFIVTNRRVIQTMGIMNKSTTDSSLEKVNDVKLEQSFWGRLFNYGTIEILTASELGVNIFHYIGAPIRFKTAMLNAKEEISSSDEHPFAKHGGRSENIPDLIAELDELRQKGIVSEEEFQRKKTDLLSRM